MKNTDAEAESNRRLHKLLSSFFDRVTFDPAPSNRGTEVVHAWAGWTPDDPVTGEEKLLDEGTIRLHTSGSEEPRVIHVERYRQGKVHLSLDDQAT